MKMIKTSYGYMTPMEAKIIGDIAREEKRQNKKASHKSMKSSGMEVSSNSFILLNKHCNNDSHSNSKNG